MALAQQIMFRAARLESGLFTTCLQTALDDNDTPFSPMTPALAGDGDLSLDIEITRAQNRNYALADGFHRMAKQGSAFTLLLRYKAQAERLYRRAVEEFGRLKALRNELPTKPFWSSNPKKTSQHAYHPTNRSNPNRTRSPGPRPDAGKAGARDPARSYTPRFRRYREFWRPNVGKWPTSGRRPQQISDVRCWMLV